MKTLAIAAAAALLATGAFAQSARPTVINPRQWTAYVENGALVYLRSERKCPGKLKDGKEALLLSPMMGPMPACWSHYKPGHEWAGNTKFCLMASDGEPADCMPIGRTRWLTTASLPRIAD